MSDRKSQIVKAATALFLREGLNVSTAMIAREANVSNGTLFNVFATKQSLIDTIYADAKTAMFGTLPHSGDDPLTRKALRENWDAYLHWANENPEDRAVVHLLLEAGLISEETRLQIDCLQEMHFQWFQKGLDDGVLRGPNVAYVAQLIFFQTGLVITESLEGADIDLAFDMLCNSIGLSP